MMTRRCVAVALAATAASAVFVGATSGIGVDNDNVDLVIEQRVEQAVAELTAKYEARLNDLENRFVQQQQQQQQHAEVVDSGGAAKRSPTPRRALASSNSALSNGLAIKRPNGGISLGMDGDVILARTGDERLIIKADGGVNVTGSVNITGDLQVGGRDIVDAIDDSYCPPQDQACDLAASPFLVQRCCAGGGWQTVYELDIEDSANYNVYADIPYTVDNSADFAIGGFRRIAYHLQLDDEWAFVSMDAFTDNATMTGLPIDWTHDAEDLTGLSVVSNAVNLTAFNGMTQGVGDVEFWSNCYGRGDDGTYDSGDVQSANTDCYGSFQVGWAIGSGRVGGGSHAVCWIDLVCFCRFRL